MEKFKIQLECENCNGQAFEAFDTIQAKEKSVYELAYKIASEGTVNLPAFKKKCVKCGTIDKVKLNILKL